jgi:hypothetical protein
MQEMQAKIAADGKKADASMISAQAQMISAKAKANEKPSGGLQPKDTSSDQMNAQARLLDAHTKARSVDVNEKEAGLKHHDLMVEDRNRDLDRQAQTQGHLMELAKTVIGHSHEDQSQQIEHKHDDDAQHAEHEHEHEVVDKDIAGKVKIARSKPKPKPAAKKD